MMRSCRVTVQDMEGVAHTVEVTAESLYEAIARGLAALRGREWVAGITHGTIKVSVVDVRVEHEVKMTEFTKWIDRLAGSPREVIQRQKVGPYWVCQFKPRSNRLDSPQRGGEQYAAADSPT